MNKQLTLRSALLRTIVVSGFIAPLSGLAGERVKMDVKLGLWESKVTSTSSGMPEIASQMKGQMEQSRKHMSEGMKDMSPEQRAKLEAAMNAAINNQGKPTQHTSQHCITKEMMDRGDMLSKKEGMENCQSQVLRNDSQRLEMKVVCTGSTKENATEGQGKGMSGTSEVLVKYAVASASDLKGTLDMKVDTGGGKFFSSHSDIEQHWLGADCHGKK